MPILPLLAAGTVLAEGVTSDAIAVTLLKGLAVTSASAIISLVPSVRAAEKEAELAKQRLDEVIRKTQEARNRMLDADRRTTESQRFARELEATRQDFTQKLEDARVAEREARAAEADAARLQSQADALERQLGGQDFQREQQERAFTEARSRDEARAADVRARQQEQDARREAELADSRLFRETIEQRRTEEAKARLDLQAAALLERQQADADRRAQLAAQEQARRSGFLPLDAEVLTPAKQIVQRVLSGGGRTLIRWQDAVAQGIFAAVSWVGGEGRVTITRLDGTTEFRPLGAGANAALQTVAVTLDDLERAGLVSPRAVAQQIAQFTELQRAFLG